MLANQISSNIPTILIKNIKRLSLIVYLNTHLGTYTTAQLETLRSHPGYVDIILIVTISTSTSILKLPTVILQPLPIF